MTVVLETRKTTNTFVIWNVGLPRLNNSVVSQSFKISGYKWNLELRTSIYLIDHFPKIDDELWEMLLHYSEKKAPLFPIKVYIRNRGKDSYLSLKEINSKTTKIWSCRNLVFKENHPDIPYVGTTLQFVLDFDLAVPYTGIPFSLKVDKSVQTTSTDNCAEEHSCLEKLSLDLCKLVEDDSEPDVLLKCGDFSMGAHKLILGARSEVFRKMMQSDMMEGREGSVEIIDMEPKILEVFIKYIYTGIVPELTDDTALPLYEAADKYQVEALKKRSGLFLTENVSPENALRILAMADAHSDMDLKRRLVSYIAEEEIPKREAEWLEFCNQHPKLANEVLNSYIKLLMSSQ